MLHQGVNMEGPRKIALITGASSGIGAGTAIHLAGKGYRLALNGRKIYRLEGVAKRCQEAGLTQDDVILVPGDVRDSSVVKSAIEQTINKFGQLDLLVNNAGTYVNKNSLESTMEEYDLLMDTNVKAVVMWSREAAPHLVKTKGNIVNVSSINSYCPFADASFYNMGKAAADMFTRCFSNEMGPKGVRVNSVNPGDIATNIYEQIGQTEEEFIKYLEDAVDSQPLKITGAVEDIAMAISYLASDDARFVTGTTLTVDGGRANIM